MPQLRPLFFNAPLCFTSSARRIKSSSRKSPNSFLVKDLVWNEKILEMIPNIKRLGRTYTTNEEYHLHHLKDLHHLEKLEVIGYGGFSWRRQNHRFPCTLKKLTLVGGGNHWKDMAAVGSLPNLQVLKLLDHACDGETWETFDGDFPRLKFLVIGKSHLRKWIAHRNSLPTLERLVLRCCWYLKEIPESIGEITTLEVIEVDCLKKVFPRNGNGSRIMLTTPELHVASYANSGSVVREMWLVGQS